MRASPGGSGNSIGTDHSHTDRILGPYNRSLLTECGFDNMDFYPSLAGTAGERHGDLIAVVACKQAPEVG